MGNLSCDRSLLIYRHLVCGFFIIILILMSISTNIHRPYVCDPLGPYISLVNNFIDPITSYWSTSNNYVHQHINKFINDQFNPIDRLSCLLFGCKLHHVL